MFGGCLGSGNGDIRASKTRTKKWLQELGQKESKETFRWEGGCPGRRMDMNAVVSQANGHTGRRRRSGNKGISLMQLALPCQRVGQYAVCRFLFF